MRRADPDASSRRPRSGSQRRQRRLPRLSASVATAARMERRALNPTKMAVRRRMTTATRTIPRLGRDELVVALARRSLRLRSPRSTARAATQRVFLADQRKLYALMPEIRARDFSVQQLSSYRRTHPANTLNSGHFWLGRALTDCRPSMAQQVQGRQCCGLE